MLAMWSDRFKPWRHTLTAFLHWLLGLEPAEWAEGGRWSLQWSAAPGGDRALWLLLLTAAAITLLVWLYRQDARRLTRPRRLTLLGLRLITFALLCIMLLEPLLILSRTESEPSNLLVLLDVSPSMHLTDAWPDASEARRVTQALALDGPEALQSSPRLLLAERLLQARLLDQLRQDGDRQVIIYPFSEYLDDTLIDNQIEKYNFVQTTDRKNNFVESTKSPINDLGQTTAIGSALRQALLRYRGTALAGVVLLSDGQNHAGTPMAEAAHLASQQRVPIAAIAVGTPGGPRNARITSLHADPVVFERDTNRVSVLIDSRGYDGETATVRLERSRGNDVWELINEQDLVLTRNGQTQEVQFTYRESARGELRLRALLDPLSFEQDEADNAALADVRVIRREMRVLLIAGSTFPEIQFLRNTLMRDKRIDLSTWLMTADAQFRHPGNTPIRRLPKTAEEINTYDCIVLYDPDPEGFGPGLGDLLQNFVGQAGGGLVYIAGEHHTRNSFDRQGDPLLSWLKLLPIVREPGLFRTAQQLTWSARNAWRLEITPEGRADTIFAFDDNPDSNQKILDRLPGMYWHFPVTRPKPGATVLARHGDPRMVNDYGPEVLLATQLVGPGRTLFIAFDSTYRWRYLGEQLFDGFWARVVDRAGRSKQLGGVYPFRLSPDRPRYEPGDPVHLNARFADPDTLDPGLIVMAAQASRGDDPPIDFTLTRNADDTFTGGFTTQRAGEHLLRVWPSEASESTLTRPATLAIDVALPDAELQQPGLNREALTSLAAATGGRVFDLYEADQIADLFHIGRVQRLLEDRQEVWDAPLFWLLLISALICEWVLRKRWRLV